MAERRETLKKNGVVFALWDGENLQLEVRKKPGNFFGFTIIPGGKVEKSESFEDALLRETKEEYGIEVLKNYPLGNPEKINDHIGVPIEKAFGLSNHPLTKTFLDVIQKEIFKLST